MALHIIKGKDGERMAREFLVNKGFVIVACNWRSGRQEIDIIAFKEKVLHFIEVKTRHSLNFGYPEEAVTTKKFNAMRKAAVAFMSRHQHVKSIQFDIVSVLVIKGRPVEFFFIEDVYFY